LKNFHTLEPQRTIDFMVSKSYLYPTAQKAYIEGINGCVKHVTVVQEIRQHAELNHKTVHMTWSDLENASGSMSQLLISHVLTTFLLH
jgi:hypothetical protein